MALHENPSGDPSIYQLLAQQLASSTTVENLNDATKNTFIDEANVKLWSSMITVAKVMQESRTYAHGLPIPEKSAVYQASVDDGAQASLKPSAPEVWEIAAIDAGATSALLFDGSASCPVPLDANGKLTIPLTITPTLYLIFDNGSGGSVTVNVAYHKVGL